MRHILRLFAVLLTTLPLFAATPYEYAPVKTNMTLITITAANSRVVAQLGGLVTTNDGGGGMFMFRTNSTTSVNATNIFDRSIPQPTNATHTAGAGTLASATYYYRVSALNALGETLPSAETSIVLTGPAGVNVNWAGVPGASGYKVYGRSTGAELFIAQVGMVHTYLDTGSITPSGALPGADTSMGGSGRWERILEPLQGSVDLATQVTGVLTVPNGGTGAPTFTGALQGNGASAVTGITGTQYGLFYWPTTSTIGTTAAGTSTTLLHGNASGAPTWGAVSLTADVSGDLPFANMVQIATGSLLGRNTAGTGDIEVITDIPTAITIGGAYIYRVGGTDVAVTDGGTGVGTFTLNGVVYGQGTSALAVTAQGAANTVLTANAGAPAFSAAINVGTSVTTPLVIGTTSVSTPSLISTAAITATPAAGSGFAINMSTTGDFAVNTDDLYVDTSTGNVGIGTTTPGATLDVAGSFRTTGGGAPSTGVGLEFSYGGGIGQILAFDRAGGLYKPMSYAGISHSFYDAGGAVRLYVDASPGNVGIGTTTPLAKLAVNGGANFGADADPGDNNINVVGLTTSGTLTITTSALFNYSTDETVAVFKDGKYLKSSGVTTTTLAFLDATSSVQTQLDARVREPQRASGDPNFNSVVGADDGQMYEDNGTGARWFWYASGAYWRP